MAADPRSLPRLQSGDLTYLGQFRVPDNDGTGNGVLQQFAWTSIGVAGMAGPNQIFFAGHAQASALVGVVEVPAFGKTAKVVTPLAQMPNLGAVGSDPSTRYTGGAMVHNGRIVVSSYLYYDGGHSQRATHWWGPSLGAMQGPALVQAQNVTLAADKHRPKAGMIAGWMGPIPQEWQALFGGPCFTGQGAIAITSRSSYGPAFSVFDPDQLGAASPVPATMLIGYPDEHQTLGPWGPTGGSWWGTTITPYYSGADTFGGMCFPQGTRSVLSIGRHGTGLPEMKGLNSYGPGTPDVTKIGQPDGAGNHYCYDPSDKNKGPHSYPYHAQVMAYDAVDLLEVKAGRKQPWEMKPYAVWNLGTGTPLDRPNVRVTGATFDPATNRLYVSAGGLDVFVFDVKAGNAPPPPDPVDCVEVSSAWGEWSAWTVAGDIETRFRERTWTQTVKQVIPGKACRWTKPDAADVVETEREERPYVPPPPPVGIACEVRSVGAYADGDLKLTVRCQTDGQTQIPVGTTFTITLP